MAETFTPVFKSILESTIWGEAPHVKIVWLTMLLQKDRNGFVASTIPGLARSAVVTVEQCKAAIEVLMSPDEYSQSKDLEGRRIVPVTGGWQVVNHDKYSDLTLKSGRERSRRHRENQLNERYGRSEKVVTHDPVTTSSVIDSDLDLNSSERSKPVGRRAEHLCPESIEPTEATLRVAEECGRDYRRDFDRMRDWSLGKGAKKVDWQAALRNWMRQAGERDGTVRRQAQPISSASPEPPIDTLGNRKKTGQVFKNGYFVYPPGAEIK